MEVITIKKVVRSTTDLLFVNIVQPLIDQLTSVLYLDDLTPDVPAADGVCREVVIVRG